HRYGPARTKRDASRSPEETLSCAFPSSPCPPWPWWPATRPRSRSTTPSSGVACEGSLCVLSGVITDDVTMTPDKEWLLRDGVFIGDDVKEVVLTIEPGTTVYGESSTDGMLVVRRHSKLIAEGTA